jgi:O-antigen/teichoic acid export membrane protein
MFTDFLSLIAGGSVFTVAFMEGRKGGALGVFVGLLIGLAAGLAVFWTTRKTLKWTITRHKLHKSNLSPERLAFAWGLILAALAWMVIAGITVTWLTRIVVGHL